jgi:hypothetical protein
MCDVMDNGLDCDWACLRCGYNLRGLVGDPIRCPECGHSNPLTELREWHEGGPGGRVSVAEIIIVATFAVFLLGVYLAWKGHARSTPIALAAIAVNVVIVWRRSRWCQATAARVRRIGLHYACMGAQALCVGLLLGFAHLVGWLAHLLGRSSGQDPMSILALSAGCALVVGVVLGRRGITWLSVGAVLVAFPLVGALGSLREPDKAKGLEDSDRAKPNANAH